MRRGPYRGRENMFADRVYSRGLVASPDRLASLLYFAAAVPTVGFIHGTGDLSPLNAAALQGCFPKRAPRMNTALVGNAQPGAGRHGPNVSCQPGGAP